MAGVLNSEKKKKDRMGPWKLDTKGNLREPKITIKGDVHLNLAYQHRMEQNTLTLDTLKDIEGYVWTKECLPRMFR